ncbi:unnamed protein product [Diatraea saccharalis]|uniref:Uncharacterized protein n=1 Tax=Diatraea saccharalis TaxID=40085 RepID=A0A9N9QZ65_9NEOP|nr:unnamed protein product [Diatraea saccharalis]
MGGAKDQRAPIKGPLPRITNIIVNNFRGILGVLVPIVFLTWRVEKGKEGIFLFIFSSMVILLLNNSGADRRIALSIICSGSSQGFCEKRSCLEANNQYPEIFNYLQYSFFAVPVAIIMYIVNLLYHTILLSITTDKPLSAASIADVRSQLLKQKSSIPHKITSHEYVSVT